MLGKKRLCGLVSSVAPLPLLATMATLFRLGVTEAVRDRTSRDGTEASLTRRRC